MGSASLDSCIVSLIECCECLGSFDKALSLQATMLSANGVRAMALRPSKLEALGSSRICPSRVPGMRACTRLHIASLMIGRLISGWRLLVTASCPWVDLRLRGFSTYLSAIGQAGLRLEGALLCAVTRSWWLLVVIRLSPKPELETALVTAERESVDVQV